MTVEEVIVIINTRIEENQKIIDKQYYSTSAIIAKCGNIELKQLLTLIEI